MSRLIPKTACFRCRSCGAKGEITPTSKRSLLSWVQRFPVEPNGLCHHCGAGSWQLTVIYPSQPADRELAILMGSPLSGGPNIVATTDELQLQLDSVSASLVAALAENESRRLEQVGRLVRAIVKQSLEDAGAQICNRCESYYLPTSTWPWTRKGYCSKTCQVEIEGTPLFDQHVISTQSASQNKIRLQCGCGYWFEVPVSYRGMRRPCPQCQQRVEVPTR